MRNHDDRPIIVKPDFWHDQNIGAVALFLILLAGTVVYLWLKTVKPRFLSSGNRPQLVTSALSSGF